MSSSTIRDATRRLVAPRRWPVACVLALVVASDYKFRLRANDQAVSGNADPFVLLEVGLYAFVACFLFLRFRPATRPRRADPLVYLAYAYAAVLVGSALYSPYYQLALVRAGQVLVVLALCRSIARHADAGAPHRIAHGYAILITGSVVFGVLVPFPRLPKQPDRFTWLYIHPVQSGAMLAIAVVLLAGYLLTHGLDRAGPRWPLPVYGVLFAICAAGLVATKTRGAVLGAIAGILVLVWTRWRGQRKVEVGVVLAVALIAIALTTSSAIESFFARGESVEQLSTLNSRTNLWAFAFDKIAEHPLYGFGLTSSRGLFLESIGLGGGHNAVINLLVDTGLVGLCVWLALLGCLLFTTHRLIRRTPPPLADRCVLLAVLFAMIVNSVFTEGLGAPANVLCTWLFVLVAWVGVLSRREAGP
ncbi:O-antigen ligase family protein [Amycolatopsis anabasis]|uniref:O-antigen ligase family protein n=1 Tax=Amycolatopsis anabasis TaxID=1840409 RepID=UPI00131A65ED|nr:O-antigen ligase family protein [Amycolatopsis anabasis]